MVGRLEAGHKSSRRNPSWPSLEAAYRWPQGFIEDFLTGKVTEAPEEARYQREPKTVTTEFVKDLVQNITLAVAPDAPLHRVVEGQRRAEAALRAVGLLPPEPNQDSDQQETNPESDTPIP